MLQRRCQYIVKDKRYWSLLTGGASQVQNSGNIRLTALRRVKSWAEVDRSTLCDWRGCGQSGEGEGEDGELHDCVGFVRFWRLGGKR